MIKQMSDMLSVFNSEMKRRIIEEIATDTFIRIEGSLKANEMPYLDFIS